MAPSGPASDWTRSPSWPRSTAPPAWPGSASWKRRTAPRWTDLLPGISRSRKLQASWNRRRRHQATSSSLSRTPTPRLARCSVRCAWRSGRHPWARARIDTCGSSTSRCSTAPAPTATRSRRTTRSPCRTPRTCPCWRPTRSPCARRRTTLFSTDGSSDRAASVSTDGTFRSRSSPHWASAPRRPRPASGSCWGPSATGHRRTPASPSGSTGWWRSWPARRTSGRSSPTRRPSPGPTC